MKYLITVLLILVSRTLCFAQVTSVVLDGKGETVMIPKIENDSVYSIAVKCSICAIQEREFKINSSKISGNDTVFKVRPKRIFFGEGYQNEYIINVTLSKEYNNEPGIYSLAFEEVDTGQNESVELISDKITETNHLVFQPQTSNNPSVNKLVKDNEEIKTNLKMLQEQLLEGDDAKEYIGRFMIGKKATVFESVKKDSLKKIYKKLKSESTTINEFKLSGYGTRKIDSVTIKITEGLIEYIKVRMVDGTYFINTKAPIQIITMEKRFNDLLFNPETNDYIILKDAVVFDANQRFNYLPGDDLIYIVNDHKNISNKKAFKKIYANAGLNAFVDLRMYTDLLGVFDNQANGLVQLEASSKLYLHRMNLPQTFAYLFYAIEPFFHLNKLDSQYDTIQAVDGNINRMELFRRSNFHAGITLNAFRCDWRPSNSLFVNLGYMFSSGAIVLEDETKTNGILHTPFAQVGISSKRLRNFGFEGSVEGLLQKFNNNHHLESNQAWEKLMSFNVTMYFFQAKKADDKFFVRFKNYLNLSERGDDFYQLQFGYSKNLSF